MRVQTRQLTDNLNLFMCIQCGKCTGGCPLATITGFNLRRLIYDLLVEDKIEVNGEALWDCSNCYTCDSRCPKDVHPAEAIIKLRGHLVEAGRVPRTVGQALTSVFRNANPFEMPRAERAAWANDLSLKNALQEPVEVLYFAGCMPSYEPRLQPVARALVKVMTTAGIEVGTLGDAEGCCGSEVRRMGEQGLFEMIVEEAEEQFAAVKAQRMITTSPHCLDVFKHQYPFLNFPVQHYSQFVASLVQEGRLTFNGRINKQVTYHDPCYLGRKNQIFDEPRAILQAISGIELVEMDRCRETSLCCEGGGGRMWFDGTNPGQRLSHDRVRQALATGAEVLATACPFCLMTLTDAVTVLGLEEQIVVKDIIELVLEAM